ncbi:transferase family-domain-containing protein [Xylariaceae sp. FL0804]|nr:transferase family-domain-containing protein [Xylariaceae sp. FL0804]
MSTRHESCTLSDLDMVSPNVLVSTFLVYRLKLDVDRTLLVEALQRGLQAAAEQIPLLSAIIQFDSGKPRRHLSCGQLKLRVRHFDHQEHPSYDELAASSFRPSMLMQDRLIPVEVYNNVIERPVIVTQLSFIRGGAVLAFGYNHVAMDGASGHLALTAICQGTRAFMEGIPQAQTCFNFSRRSLTPPQQLLQIPKEIMAARIEDYTIIHNASRANAVNAASAATKIGTTDAAHKALIYKIQACQAQKLKGLCKPMDGLEYISTYDCVVALLWRSLMRVRAQLKPELAEGESRILHAVDLRGRGDPALSMSYIGNAVKQVGTVPLPMTKLLGPGGLSLAASRLRSSVLATTLAVVGEATALGRMTGPSESVMFSPRKGIADGDFMVTSWYFMESSKYDFGMGAPSSFRPPNAGVPGFAYVLPDFQQQTIPHHYEIFITLPVAEQDSLEQDIEFRAWFDCL